MNLNPNPGLKNRILLRRLYKQAFPKEERKPYSIMKKKQKEGRMELITLEEDGKFLGLVFTILHKDVVLLDYFAVSPAFRGKGIGSAVLTELQIRYPGKRIILEIEDPEEPCSNREDRIRRKAFYLRNGLTVQDYKVWLFGIKMLILTNGRTVTYEEYHEIFDANFPKYVGENITFADAYEKTEAER